MAVRQAGSEEGRVAQKRRTRAAIVGATKQLLAQGQQPSIDDIAAAADVSRRTIYMYFPTLDQLLVDASSGLLSERTIEPMLDAGALSTDPVTRVDEYAAALLAMAPEALPNARRILRLTVDAEQPPDNERRGYRRIEWLGRVLEPHSPPCSAGRR
jgi:AcrR family transcriptional regulator